MRFGHTKYFLNIKKNKKIFAIQQVHKISYVSIFKCVNQRWIRWPLKKRNRIFLESKNFRNRERTFGRCQKYRKIGHRIEQIENFFFMENFIFIVKIEIE